MWHLIQAPVDQTTKTSSSSSHDVISKSLHKHTYINLENRCTCCTHHQHQHRHHHIECLVTVCVDCKGTDPLTDCVLRDTRKQHIEISVQHINGRWLLFAHSNCRISTVNRIIELSLSDTFLGTIRQLLGHIIIKLIQERRPKRVGRGVKSMFVEGGAKRAGIKQNLLL